MDTGNFPIDMHLPDDLAGADEHKRNFLAANDHRRSRERWEKRYRGPAYLCRCKIRPSVEMIHGPVTRVAAQGREEVINAVMSSFDMIRSPLSPGSARILA